MQGNRRKNKERKRKKGRGGGVLKKGLKKETGQPCRKIFVIRPVRQICQECRQPAAEENRLRNFSSVPA